MATIDVLGWLDSLHAMVPGTDTVTNEKLPEAQAARAEIVDLLATAALVVTGAMPATAVKLGCSDTAIRELRAALARVGAK